MHPPEFPHSYSIYKQIPIWYHAILFHSNAMQSRRDVQRSIITILAHVQFRAFFRAQFPIPWGSSIGFREATTYWQTALCTCWNWKTYTVFNYKLYRYHAHIVGIVTPKFPLAWDLQVVKIWIKPCKLYCICNINNSWRKFKWNQRLMKCCTHNTYSYFN
jgi:hypothetical protein